MTPNAAPSLRPPTYAGPTGSIAGTISVVGDRAPAAPAQKLSDKCRGAADFYGPLFREGMMRALPDVLVTVTGYPGGSVAPKAEVLSVEGRRCAWTSRTFGLVLGQRIEVKSADGEPYMPELAGATMTAQMVAIPGGDVIKLYADRPGRYQLRDTLHPFMVADVFVVKFPTFAVTAPDGRYRIDGIPPGPSTLTALLPAIRKSVEKKVTIEAGKTLEGADLEIAFDAVKDVPKPPAPAPQPTIR